MAKQSRESIISELNARKIGYSDEMSYKELCELLNKAKAEDEAAEEPKPIISADYTGVRCGLSTIHDHETRLRIIERKLGL